MRKTLSAIKPYLPRLSLIPIGVLMLAAVWKTKHWIAFPIGMIGIVLIIVSLKSIEKKLHDAQEEEDPYFFDDPVFTERWEKSLHILAPMFMIVTFLGLKLMSYYTVNLIREGLFALVSSGIGLAVASIITQLILKRYPFLTPKTETRSKEISCLWGGIGISTALIIIALNFFLRPTAQVQQKVAILEHGSKRSKPQAFIWVDYEGEKMKLRPYGKDYDELIGQDSAILTISTGGLGFDYVSKMSLVSH